MTYDLETELIGDALQRAEFGRIIARQREQTSTMPEVTAAKGQIRKSPRRDFRFKLAERSVLLV